MAKKNSGLGRGLDAIFLDNYMEETEAKAASVDPALLEMLTQRLLERLNKNV